MRVKKKYLLAWAIFLVGSVVALRGETGLGEWTAFGTFLLSAFAASDVADKKLNGGQY